MALPFGPWLPDQPDLGNATLIAKNVLVSSLNGKTGAVSYKQVRSFQNTITALAQRIQGAIAVKATGGGAYIYAGTAATLQEIGAGAGSFTDRSKVGGYSCGADERWSFARYAENVFAANIADPVQAKAIGAASAFADLSAAAPKARHLAVFNNFLVLANLVVGGVAMPNALRWSGIDAPDSYPTVGSDAAIEAQSDLRELPEGGAINGTVGGELGGYAVCETKIYRGTYVGSPLFIDFQPVEENRGSRYPGSIIGDGRLVFYLNADGFWMFDGLQSVPIGSMKVDSWFLADLDPLHVPRICAAIDPVNKVVMWGYPGAGNAAGSLTKIIVYHWAIGTWSYFEASLEWLLSGLSLGYTLDSLDALGLSLDDLPYSLDSYVYAGGIQTLVGFDTSHRMGYFSGAAMAATLTTGEAQLSEGQRSLVTAVRPLAANVGTSVTVTPITRNRQIDTATSGAASTINAAGVCPMMAEARYHRFQVDITGGFTHAQGVDPTFSASGDF
jgi:hypothetical protein